MEQKTLPIKRGPEGSFAIRTSFNNGEQRWLRDFENDGSLRKIVQAKLPCAARTSDGHGGIDEFQCGPS
jgi:hypothetical protein